MTQISLSKVLVIIDKERGAILAERKLYEKGGYSYQECSALLRALNRLKKEFQHLPDTDQIPLGL